jgi:hypothetical protein
MLVDTARQRKTERHRRWREKKHNGSVVTYPIDTGETRNEFTFNKMSKCRAIKKLKCALPRTPVKRVATVKTYLSCKKSPTVQELQRQRVVPSLEEIKDVKLNKSVLEDLRSVISSEKRKRNDKSREIIDVVTASVSFCQSQYKSRNCVGNIAESFQDLGYSKLVMHSLKAATEKVHKMRQVVC